MYRPVVIFTGMFIAGVVFNKLSIISVFALMFLIFANISAIRDFSKNKKILFYLILLNLISILIFLFGLYKSISISNITETEKLFTENNYEKATFYGEVIDIFPIEEGYKYLFEVDKVRYKKSYIKLQDNNRFFLYDKDNSLEIGDYVSLYTKPLFVDEVRNEGEFDLKTYYKIRNISGYLFPNKIKILNKKHSLKNTYNYFISNIRMKIITVNKNNYDKDAAGIIISMLTGYKYYMDQDIKTSFEMAGFAHILAISGLHISILGLGLFRKLQKDKTKYLSSLCITLFILMFYSSLTGNQVSCIRAIMSLLFSIFAEYTGKRNDQYTTLSFSAFLLLLKTPGYIYDISFIMSFTAGLGIALITPIIDKLSIKKIILNKKIKDIIENISKKILFSVFIQIVLLPVQLNFFYYYNPYTVLLNSLLLPVIDIVFICMIIFSVIGIILPSLLSVLCIVLNSILKTYIIFTGFINKFPGAYIVTGKISLLRTALIISVILISFSLIKNNNIKTSLYILCIIVILIIPYKNKDLKIAHLYVGQGDCCVITKGNTSVIIDCGSSDKKDIYKYTVSNYLKYMGYKEPDYIILSHSDLDHISGAVEYLNETKANIKTVFILPKLKSTNGFEEIYNNTDNILLFEAGDSIKIKDMKFVCLNPDINNNNISDNASSLVMLFMYKNYNELFMGDLTSEYEDKVAEYFENYKLNNNYNLKVEVLKVGHHGSKGSSSENFLKTINPEVSIISCGIDNTYGHPHQETLDRIKGIDSQIYCTKEFGEIFIKENNIKYKIFTVN